MAVGLGYWQMMRLIILPQALKITIPNIVNTYHRPVQGHDARLHRRHLRFPEDHRGGAHRSELGDAGDQHHRLCLRRDLLSDLLLRHVALCAVRRSPARRAATAAEGDAMAQQTAQIRAQARAAQDRRRRRADRRAQVVRRFPRAARHQPARDARRAHRDLRAVRLRQVDHDPLHQPPRGASAGPHHRRRHRTRPTISRRSTRSAATSAWCSSISTCSRISPCWRT